MLNDVVACTGCGRVLRLDAAFCPNCGRPRGAEPGNTIPGATTLPDDSFSGRWAELRTVIWLFGLLLASSLVLGWVSRIDRSPWPEAITSGIDAVVILAFAIWRYRAILPLLRLPTLTARSFLAVSTVIAISFGTIWTYFAILKSAGFPFIHLAQSFRNAHWSTASMFVLVCLMPAIFEELAFRGVIQSGLERVLDEREALVIQAALFSVLHLTPLIFASHFLIGLCFGYVRRRTGSLYPGMVLHGSWNAFVLAGELYGFA